MKLPSAETTWNWLSGYSMFNHKCESACCKHSCGNCVGIMEDIKEVENTYIKFKEIVDETPS